MSKPLALLLALLLAPFAAQAVTPQRQAPDAAVKPPEIQPPGVTARETRLDLPVELNGNTIRQAEGMLNESADSAGNRFDGTVTPGAAPPAGGAAGGVGFGGKSAMAAKIGAPKIGETTTVTAKGPQKPKWDEPTIGFISAGALTGGLLGLAFAGSFAAAPFVGMIVGALLLFGLWRMGGYKKKEAK